MPPSSPRNYLLGHLFNDEGIRLTPNKVKGVSNYPKPSNIAELRQFWGIVNFNRRSLSRVALTKAPSHAYIHDSRKNDKRIIQRTPEVEDSFVKVKTDLANSALRYRCFWLRHEATLKLGFNEIWSSLAFFSHKFSITQHAYSTFERELTAAYEVLKHFRYLRGCRNVEI